MTTLWRRWCCDCLGRLGKPLAVAESCTGGALGAALTAVPGSSAVFAGGVIAYSNAVKQQLLDVPAALLDQHGAVSEPVVKGDGRGACALGFIATGASRLVEWRAQGEEPLRSLLAWFVWRWRGQRVVTRGCSDLARVEVDRRCNSSA